MIDRIEGPLDALNRIAKSLDEFGKPARVGDLFRYEFVMSTHDRNPLYWKLKLALEHRIRRQNSDEIALIDLVLQELQFAGRDNIRAELGDRLTTILESLKAWEHRWQASVKKHGRSIPDHVKALEANRLKHYPNNPEITIATYRPEGADYLGRLTDETECDAIEQFEEVRDLAANAATWIRGFVAAQKSKHQAREQERQKQLSLNTKETQKKTSNSTRTTKKAVKKKNPQRDNWIINAMQTMTAKQAVARWNTSHFGEDQLTEAMVYAVVKRDRKRTNI